MRRSTWLKCCLVVSVMFLSICLAPAVHAQQKTVTLNYSNFMPAPHKISQLSEEWCREIEKRTNGGIKITMFHGGTLTPSTQAYDGVVKGLSDIAMGVFGYHRGRFPLTEFSDLPLGLKSGVTMANLFNEYYAKFKPKEMDDVKVLYLHGNPPSTAMTVSKPVLRLEDIKGLKMRVSPLATPVMKALGAAPVAMPMGDVYDALSKKVVDGGFFPFEALEGWKLGEVVKYGMESCPISWTSSWYVVMNKEKWNSLPPEWQKIIEKVSVEWIEKTGKVWDEVDAAGKAYFTGRGGKITPLSAAERERWVKAVQPVLDDYVKMTKAKGLPGDQVLKFALDYMKQHDK
jgi:TRAP-type C4-dicarboxylate transport system substrate-binding protein